MNKRMDEQTNGQTSIVQLSLLVISNLVLVLVLDLDLDLIWIWIWI